MHDLQTQTGYTLTYDKPVGISDVINLLITKSGIRGAQIAALSNRDEHLIMVHDGKPKEDDPAGRSVGKIYFSISYTPTEKAVPARLDATSSEFQVDGEVTLELIEQVQKELSGSR